MSLWDFKLSSVTFLLVRRNLVYTHLGTCGNTVVFNYLEHQRDALDLMPKCKGVIILFAVLSMDVCSHV